MKTDLIKIVESKDLSNYKIKYKIRQRYDILDDWHQLVIKYKKKNALFYKKIYKNLEYFSFAFTDIITLSNYDKDKDFEIFRYLKKHSNDDILENMVKYAIIKDINEKNELNEKNKIKSVPLKWLFYTSIKNK